MKCPECSNDLGSGKHTMDRCECGWKRGPGGVKRCTADGPRDLLAFQSASMRFRLAWAKEHGFYRDGGIADQSDDNE